ncbi:MAG: O-antigen ligase family protein [Vicinamibacteria bacterium]
MALMWVLLAMVLIMPFEENPYLYLSDSFLGLFPDFTLIKLLGLLGVCLVGWEMVSSNRPLHLLHSSQAKALMAFLFASLLAAILGGASIQPMTRMLSIILLLPFIVAAVRTPARLELVLKTATAAWILVFPYALRQYFRYEGRFGVGLSEPNYVAISLLLFIPLTLVFARYERILWKRTFWKVGAALLLVSIVLTGSRGGFLGLVVIAGLVVMRLMRARLTALVGLGFAFLVALFVVPNPLLSRLAASGEDSSGVEASNRERVAVFKGGLRMIREHPITGVGLGNFKSKMEEYGDLETSKIAHNTYLEIAAELGLPALATFLLVALATYRSLDRSSRMALKRGDGKARDLLVAIQIGLTGYLIAAIFLSAQYERDFWLIVFLTICAERIVRAEAARSEPVERRAERGLPQPLPSR